MNPIKTGATFLAVGVVMNIIGRVLLAATRESNSAPIALFLAAWMIVSVALAVFGLFKMLFGALRKPKTPTS